MENKEIIESLDRLLAQIDVLKAESGPKSNDFIKWVREVKQFIEKAFGSDYPQLRAFKKIDYYPKQFDILSSESAFKKAWIEGLMQAKAILEGIRAIVSGIPIEEKNVAQENAPTEEIQNVSEKIENPPVIELKTEPVKETAPKENKVKPEEKKQEAKETKEVKKESSAPEKRESPVKGKKILLVDIDEEKLNANIFTFIKKMGYEPVVVDHDTEGDIFVTDILTNSTDGDPAFAIVHWKGHIESSGIKLPKPCVIFSTGYYVAKLTSKKVLIICHDDIDCYDENYSGLNFLVIDNIWELMELKLAREMDAAGLNIDFNFLKKK
ncbi:MAG: hypothetical protein FWH43_04335 [Endomicrobia bacterium]|nr:hypothetical protein [Endomicrobiia bacterium]